MKVFLFYVLQCRGPPLLKFWFSKILEERLVCVMAEKKEHFIDSVAKLKETHPVLAWALHQIIVTILLGIMVNLIAMAIGQTIFPAKVYEKSRTTSPIICHLELLQQVEIIGDEPYYFQIELTNTNAKVTIVGFVSKQPFEGVDVQKSPTQIPRF